MKHYGKAMYQLFNVYLQNTIVYNLVFKVLNYNFNNEDKTKQFLSILTECLSKNTNMTKRQIKKLIDKQINTYFDAAQAIEYGIADEII